MFAFSEVLPQQPIPPDGSRGARQAPGRVALRVVGQRKRQVSDPKVVVESLGQTQQEALVRMASAFQAWIASVAELFRCAVERFILNPPPALLQFAADLQRIEQSPPVPGYEAILIDKGHHPLAARILALNLFRLGKQRLEEIRAERKLASAIFGVVKAGDATPLVISLSAITYCSVVIEPVCKR